MLWGNVLQDLKVFFLVKSCLGLNYLSPPNRTPASESTAILRHFDVKICFSLFFAICIPSVSKPLSMPAGFSHEERLFAAS